MFCHACKTRPPEGYGPSFHSVAAVLEPRFTSRDGPVSRALCGASSIDFLWAVGLFEGEGSIAIKQGGKVALTLGTTDRDVFDRFHRVLGVGNVSSQLMGRNKRTKTLWNLTVNRIADVISILNAFYPQLGKRRQMRAIEALDILRRRIDEATCLRPCAFCDVPFRPTFNSQSSRRRFCTTSCQNRHHWRLRYERERRGEVERRKAAA